MPECDATCKPWYGSNGEKIVYIEQECSHKACVKIDGMNLCLKHAGTIAVRKLISLKMAEQIPRIYNQPNICSLDKH